MVSAAPLIAGNAAGNLASAIVPLNLLAASEVILAAGTVPEPKLLALRLVSEAPEPLNVVAVRTPTPNILLLLPSKLPPSSGEVSSTMFEIPELDTSLDTPTHAEPL